MSRRSLRPRTSTPSYKLELDIGDEEDEIPTSSSSGDDERSTLQHKDAAMADAPHAAMVVDGDNGSVASTSAGGRKPRGRGRGGTPARGRGANRGRGGRARRRSGSYSSGSDFAPPSPAGSAGEASAHSSEDDDSDAYSSEPGSMRAISDDGSIGDSDVELAGARGGGRRRSSGGRLSRGEPSSKPGVIKQKQKRSWAGGKSRASGTSVEEAKRENVWAFSEGNAPLVPHYSSYLLAPPSLRARSDLVRTIVPQRPLRIEEVTGRVRTFTASILGMTPWDAWAGEGWRPDSSAQAASADDAGDDRKDSWQGVEKDWSGLRSLSAQQAAPYLPARFDAPPIKLLAGHLTPSSPQTMREFPVLAASSLESHGIRKTGCIFNPGGPVWSVDWCPMSEHESEKRDWKLYLAVAAHSSLESDAPLGHTKPADTRGSIQLWSVAPTAELKERERRVPVKTAQERDEGLAVPQPSETSRKGRPTKLDPEEARLGRNRKAVEKRRQKKAAEAVAKEQAKSRTGKGKAAAKPGLESGEVDGPEGSIAGANGGSGVETPDSDLLIVAPRDDLSAAAPDVGLSSAADRVAAEAEPTESVEADEVTSEPAGDVKMEVQADETDNSAEWDMEMRLAMVVCVEGGQPCRLQWCPIDVSDPISGETGSNAPKIGVLAGTFEDGTVKLFAVPDPDSVRASQNVKADDPVYIHLQPLTVLEVDDAALLSLDWGSDKVLATGTSHGRIATWNVQSLALSGEEDPLPLTLSQVHDSAVRAVCYVRAPQADALGQYRFDWEQHLLVSTGNNRIVLTDLREHDSFGLPLRSGRSSSMHAAAASVQNGSVMVADGDYQAYMYAMRPRGVGMMRRTTSHQGAIWGLSTSDYHPNLASASADGALTITNTLRGTTKNRAAWVTLMETVYRMDKNSKTGELRMLDNLLPQSLNTTAKAKGLNAVGATKSFSDKALKDLNAAHAVSQAWAPEVGVLSTAWNSGGGIGRAGLLASGMACGLARVDVLVDGRWRPGKDRTREELVQRLRRKEVFF